MTSDLCFQSLPQAAGLGALGEAGGRPGHSPAAGAQQRLGQQVLPGSQPGSDWLYSAGQSSLWFCLPSLQRPGRGPGHAAAGLPLLGRPGSLHGRQEAGDAGGRRRAQVPAAAGPGASSTSHL